MKKAWAIRRRPQDERWDPELVASIQGTPQRWSEEEAGEDRVTRVKIEPRDEEEPDELSPTKAGGIISIYLQMSDFQQYGYTERCDGCRKMQLGKKAPFPHNRACIIIIEEIIK